RLAPQLSAACTDAGRIAATVYRQAAHLLSGFGPAARSSELEIYAHHLGHRDLAHSLAAAAPDRPWRTKWSHGRADTDHQTLTGHEEMILALATSEMPDGTRAIVSSSEDCTVRIWRLTDGSLIGEPITGHDGPVQAMASTE